MRLLAFFGGVERAGENNGFAPLFGVEDTIGSAELLVASPPNLAPEAEIHDE